MTKRMFVTVSKGVDCMETWYRESDGQWITEHIKARGCLAKVRLVNGKEVLEFNTPSSQELCDMARLVIDGTVVPEGGTVGALRYLFKRVKSSPIARGLAAQLATF